LWYISQTDAHPQSSSFHAATSNDFWFTILQTIFRHPTLEDATALTALARKTYVETFVIDYGIPYPKADLNEFFESSYSLETTREQLQEQGAIWWVAERNGELVGYVTAGPNTLPHPEARSTHMELRRLYITKSAQGLGVGSKLFKLALDWMQANTDGPLWIGVWSGNVKAQKLYRCYGFEKVGEYQYPVGGWMDDEYILRRM
jgi:GNAT superfamily N-acetyltransferase